jgi:starch synthase
MQILYVISEVAPWIKTGGLADVGASLPKALRQAGVDFRLLVPAYADLLAQADALQLRATLRLHDVPGRILETRLPSDVPVYLVDCPGFADRHGNPYMQPDGHGWDDNAQRFNRLALAAAALARDLLPFHPQVIHLNDWQTGLVPVHMLQNQSQRPIRTIFTIHNLAYQGVFPAHLLPQLDIQPHWMTLDGLEFHGQLSFIKGGIALSDHITTVSPSYAQEIQTLAYGEGLDGLLRSRNPHLSGILNGIDTEIWNPETDPLIPARYGVATLERRADNTAALRAQFGLAASGLPLFGVVSRLTGQKGMDLLLAALPALLGEGGALVLLGSGEAALCEGFRAASARHPGRVGVRIGYDEGLAHLIQAGSDALLVPSRFEPCGLTQLCALRYGAIPVVSRVGGLADTVIDANEAALAAGVATGVQFAPVTESALVAAIRRVVTLWRDRPRWRGMQRNAMRAEVGWEQPARQYAALYRELAAERRGG